MLDDVSAQSSLLKRPASLFVHRVAASTAASKETVASKEVLTQVKSGAVVLEGAAAVRPRALVVVDAHLDHTHSNTHCVTHTLTSGPVLRASQ